jgi:hypothetical protein
MFVPWEATGATSFQRRQALRSRTRGPGLVWRETGPDYCSGSWRSQPRGTVMLESATGRWVACLRLEDPPPGLSPITTVGRYDTVDAAQVATDEVWAARSPS